LDTGSELYRDPPDEVLLAPAAEDWLESLYAAAPSELTPAAVDELVDERLSGLRLLVDVVLEQLPARRARWLRSAASARRSSSRSRQAPPSGGRQRWSVSSRVSARSSRSRAA
jgi:hypothetical protein